jgi:hypothetical protein
MPFNREAAKIVDFARRNGRIDVGVSNKSEK